MTDDERWREIVEGFIRKLEEYRGEILGDRNVREIMLTGKMERIDPRVRARAAPDAPIPPRLHRVHYTKVSS